MAVSTRSCGRKGTWRGRLPSSTRPHAFRRGRRDNRRCARAVCETKREQVPPGHESASAGSAVDFSRRRAPMARCCRWGSFGSSSRMARSPLPGKLPRPLPADTLRGSALDQISRPRRASASAHAMTKSEREIIPDVGTSRRGLQEGDARCCKRSQTRPSRSRDTPESIEREITDLEAKANPSTIARAKSACDSRASECGREGSRRPRKTRADSETKLEKLPHPAPKHAAGSAALPVTGMSAPPAGSRGDPTGASGGKEMDIFPTPLPSQRPLNTICGFADKA